MELNEDRMYGRVSRDGSAVDYEGNCGNISTAVGPFAVDEGLVAITEPITRVRIFNTNTGKIIEAEVPVSRGRAVAEGNYVQEGGGIQLGKSGG